MANRSKTVLDHLSAMLNVAGVDIKSLDDMQISAMGSHLRKAMSLMESNPYKLADSSFRDVVLPSAHIGKSSKTYRRGAKTKALRERQRMVGTVDSFRRRAKEALPSGRVDKSTGWIGMEKTPSVDLDMVFDTKDLGK